MIAPEPPNIRGRQVITNNKTAGVVGTVYWIRSQDMDGNDINIPLPTSPTRGKTKVKNYYGHRWKARDYLTNREYRIKSG